MPDMDTPYGKVDADALQTLQETFNTLAILRAVDQLDAIRARCEPDGLRDDLLRLHGMAHTVINGASLSYVTNGPTLMEQFDAVMEELDDWIAMLRQTQRALLPLEKLRPEFDNWLGDNSE
ncbi:Tn3 family transposase post-transcriptional regulator TnpC [Cupriavidus sp. amp6]|uniref:Tn3 family transposase post-transcriptional regulator TnpC n=1 Tax=Cupriavidus sp. amp6 TaxID=388051 RepID=UPI00056B2666|nr:Tn3 family transposase post-transcriptional regulator TnpC [Cupriavidus sp. amp6]